jgi:hypothetical protein
MKRSSRTTAKLSKSLQQQLNMYALVASAAGVGVFSLAQPAEARIIYTPKHVDCSRLCRLDINNDGRPDFFLGNSGETGATSCGFSSGLGAVGYSFGESHSYRNEVMGKNSWPYRAYALLAGVRIRTVTQPRPGMATVQYNFCYKTAKFTGQWANGGKGVRNRYLGLKFYVNGEAHYGWARLNVVVHRYHQRNFQATLTGYAYETIPNKPIIAGKTKGPDVTTVQPASLGHLAAGASAIPAWRVKRTAATTH